MISFRCPECSDPVPHDHGVVRSPAGNSAPAIIYRDMRENTRAEVRDSETGEVIFPAVKGPLKLIAGGKAPQ